MQQCRGCGGYIAQGWKTCKICGLDPASAPATPLPPPQGSWSTTTAPRGGGPPPGRPGWVVPVLGAVAVLAVVAVAFVLLQGDDDPQPAASADTTTTTTSEEGSAEPGSGTPTSAEYIAAIQFANERDITMSEAAWLCAGQHTVDALGGPQRLTEQGVGPDDFAGTGGISASVVPPGARDQVAAGLLGCGIDFALIVHELLVGTSAPAPELMACFQANLDQAIAARDVAAQLLGESNASPARQEYFRHANAIVPACV